LQEVGAKEAPITDRASTFGWQPWLKATKDAGLRPCFGVELGVTHDIAAAKPVVDYWTFLARDDLRPINDLVAVATSQFRGQPLLRMDQAFEAVGTCSVLVGHRAQLSGYTPPDGPIAIGLTGAINRGYLRAALANGWQLAATSDNRFPRVGDASFYEVLVGRNAEVQTYPQHILDPTEWRASIDHLGLSEVQIAEAQAWSARALDASVAQPEQADLPHIARTQSLREMCEDGAKALGVDLTADAYRERLDRELEIISQKGYEDYFFIVADLVQWARGEMIVGPARGSSCGSLVCYLLRITTIDPLVHGLIFERFVDINRADMPDIDVDFSDTERHRVFAYLEQRYGHEHVARLGTVAFYRSRSALGEVGVALRIPPWVTDAVSESLVIDPGDGRTEMAATLEDTEAGQRLLQQYPAADILRRFEGHPRHYGQHAAGVVVASKPISRYVAIDARTNATMCDKRGAEALNLLKIDALGLTQLSVIEDTLEAAELPYATLDSIPLDDPEAFAVLNERRFAGVFQFNGSALQSLMQGCQVTAFSDIAAITALARPGPLQSGGAHQWVRRKMGRDRVHYPHKLFEPILRDTLGIVVYQEQVMEIGRQIGDLDWGAVSELRRAMSRSLGAAHMAQFKDPWIRAAKAKGIPERTAERVWNELCAYGAWAFNKSHAVAYGLVSYWCCWLKAHYRHEFAAATLTHERNPDAQLKLLRELQREGIAYLPVDPDRSTAKWTVRKTPKPILIGPLSNIIGIGPRAVETILSARTRTEPLPDAIGKRLAAHKTKLDSLWPITEAKNRFLPQVSIPISSPIQDIGDLRKEAHDQTVLVCATPAEIKVVDENDHNRVARRGHAIQGDLTTSLNLTLADDTGTILGKVSRWDYPKLGPPIVDRGKAGNALYLVKGVFRGHRGDVLNTFRMISIKRIVYIGDIDSEHQDHDDNHAVSA
jgi:DNA polymerase III alpha subunit